MTTSVIIRKNKKLEEVICHKNDNIEKFMKNKGYGEIKLYNTWIFDDNLEVLMYGWTTGKYTNINKYELPEPVDHNLYYGDLFFQLKEDDVLIDFTIEMFEEFYTSMFDGFEDIENTEDEDIDYLKEDYDYSDGFLVRD